MSHFYGTIRGKAKTAATRCGTKASRLETIAASWQGAVKVSLSHDETTGRDMASVELMPWYGSGTFRVLYRGPVSGITDSTDSVAAYGREDIEDERDAYNREHGIEEVDHASA